MNAIRQMYKFTAALVCLFMGVAFLGNNANAQAKHAQEKVVRCDKGKSVQPLLDANFPARPLTLRLVGTCPGFEITQNDISIVPFNDDVCPGATVAGRIFMNGADRIEIRCIGITSAEDGEEDNGMELVNSTASLEDVDITDHDAGLEVTARSLIGVERGLISGNFSGVTVDSVGSADLNDTHIRDNDDFGVYVVQMSRFTLSGGSITGNGGDGIFLDFHSTAELGSGAQIMDNDANNISVNRDSGVGLNVLVNGVVCDGLESSVRPLANAPGTNCTDF